MSDDRNPGPRFLKGFAQLALAWMVPVALVYVPTFLEATGLCWGGWKDRECISGIGWLEMLAIFSLLPISVMLLFSITLLVIVSSAWESIDRARAARRSKRSLP